MEVFRAAQEGRPAELQSPPPAVAPGSEAASDSKLETVCGVTIKRSDADIALRVDQFPAVAKTLCGFPSFFAAPLFRRIKKLYGLQDSGSPEEADEAGSGSKEGKPGDGKQGEGAAAGGDGGKAKASGDDSDSDTDEDKGASWGGCLPMHAARVDSQLACVCVRASLCRGAGQVPLRVFLKYWQDEMRDYDHVDRFFRLTKQPDSPHIVKSDLLPLMEELLAFHPGLAFLESTPEFQVRRQGWRGACTHHHHPHPRRACNTVAPPHASPHVPR